MRVFPPQKPWETLGQEFCSRHHRSCRVLPTDGVQGRGDRDGTSSSPTAPSHAVQEHLSPQPASHLLHKVWLPAMGDTMAEGFWDRPASLPRGEAPRTEVCRYGWLGQGEASEANPKNQLLGCHQGHFVSPRRITHCYRPKSLISRRLRP